MDDKFNQVEEVIFKESVPGRPAINKIFTFTQVYRDASLCG